MTRFLTSGLLMLFAGIASAQEPVLYPLKGDAANAKNPVLDHVTVTEDLYTPMPSVENGWTPLFNGKDLTGWTASENKDTFSVEDGLIVVRGDRSHLFYTGDVNDGEFKDFELWVEVKTEPKANSGIYFHTEYQETDWPMKGYEVQVNQSHEDPRKTGGLYGIVDVMDVSPVEDGEWYVEHITVKGKHIVVRVNGKVTADYTEPEGVEREGRMVGRKIDKGTFALQGHDPGSVIRYRQVWVKPLD
jgi:hypothetical protein